MALNVSIQVYRGTLTNLASLASTGKAGVLAWTTDTHELYVDSGSGTGIGAGNAWVKVAHDLVNVNAQTGTTYSLAASDRGKLVTLSNASPVAVTLPQATATGGNFPAGWASFVENIGAGAATITPTTSTIDGAATLVLQQYQSVLIVSDGTNYYTVRGKGTIVATGAVSHEFVTAIAADGTATLAQPAFTDISGSLSQGQLPATIGAGSNLTAIDCGTF
jgi:hypothetical protein